MNWVANHTEVLQWAYNKAGEKLNREVVYRKSHFDKKARERPLKLGTRVYLRNHPRGRCKIADSWQSTVYKVVSRPGDAAVYVVEQADGTGDQHSVHRRELCECPPQHVTSSTKRSHQQRSPPAPGSEETDTATDASTTSTSSPDPLQFCYINEDSDSSEGSSPFTSDGDSSDPDVLPTPVRRSMRTTKGRHSNPFNHPRSAIKAQPNSAAVNSVMQEFGKERSSILIERLQKRLEIELDWKEW